MQIWDSSLQGWLLLRSMPETTRGFPPSTLVFHQTLGPLVSSQPCSGTVQHSWPSQCRDSHMTSSPLNWKATKHPHGLTLFHESHWTLAKVKPHHWGCRVWMSEGSSLGVADLGKDNLKESVFQGRQRQSCMWFNGWWWMVSPVGFVKDRMDWQQGTENPAVV